MAAFQKKPRREPSAAAYTASTPRKASVPTAFTPINKPPQKRKLAYVRVSPVHNRHEYEYYEPGDEVESIVRQYGKLGEMRYEVRLAGDMIKQVRQKGE